VAYGGFQARSLIRAVLPPAYARVPATPDLSRVCDLHHSSRQRQILNPQSKARDQTHNVMVPSRIHFCCTTKGTLFLVLIILLFIQLLLNS